MNGSDARSREGRPSINERARLPCKKICSWWDTELTMILADWELSRYEKHLWAWQSAKCLNIDRRVLARNAQPQPLPVPRETVDRELLSLNPIAPTQPHPRKLNSFPDLPGGGFGCLSTTDAAQEGLFTTGVTEDTEKSAGI
jgi:hypothetical protein